MSTLIIESNVTVFFSILTILIVTLVLNQPWFTLKSLKKHFTAVNMITGFISLIVIFCVKEAGLSLIVLNLLQNYIHNIPDCSEYIIAAFIGLICRLGLKGLIEDGFKEIFPIYNAMTGTGGINPTEDNNSVGIKENTSGSSSLTSNSTGIQKESLSDKGKIPKEVSDSLNTGKVQSNFSSKRFVKLFDEHAERINSEIKVLSSEINNCKNEEEKAFMEEDLEELFGQLTMLSKESAAETRKILSTDSQSNDKRTSDSTVAENPSKKRS